MDYSKMNQEKRDACLKSELDEDKVRLLEKYNLISTPDLYWISKHENAHDQIIFKHSFVKKNDIITILCRLNKLCFAKVKYLRQKSDLFQPYIYNYREGFQPAELWNSEFLRHRPSGFYIDLRNLQFMYDNEKFRDFCAYLDSFE
jgi:hypothetical protein